MYNQDTSKNIMKINDMILSGKLAIIPVGFRCHTKMKLKKVFHLSQESLPFDSGFFPPNCVADILQNKKIELSYKDDSHTVCTKTENYYDATWKAKGIKFETSTYEKINAQTIQPDMKDINSYLDSTYGYYTLSIKHHFVLAHFNWHTFAKLKNPNYIYDPIKNIDMINQTLNRRLDRLFQLCHTAQYIIFVFSNDEEYQFMQIDETYFDLNNLQSIQTIVDKIFSGKSYVLNFNEISHVNTLIKLLKI